MIRFNLTNLNEIGLGGLTPKSKSRILVIINDQLAVRVRGRVVPLLAPAELDEFLDSGASDAWLIEHSQHLYRRIATEEFHRIGEETRGEATAILLIESARLRKPSIEKQFSLLDQGYLMRQEPEEA